MTVVPFQVCIMLLWNISCTEPIGLGTHNSKTGGIGTKSDTRNLTAEFIFNFEYVYCTRKVKRLNLLEVA